MFKLSRVLFVLFLGSLTNFANAFQQQSVDGPNHLNAALLATGVIKHIRYTSNNEMWTILNSPICRQVEDEGARQEKDIGVILTGNNLISHAFALVNQNLAFEKRSANKNDPYQVTSLSDLKKSFNLQPFRYYRCQSLDSFVLERKPKIKMFMRNTIKELEAIEGSLQEYISKFYLYQDQNKYLEIERDLQVLSRKLSLVAEFGGDSDEENLIFKMMASRFVSIARQIQFLGFDKFYSLVSEWENQDHNIGSVFQILLAYKVQDDLDRAFANVRKRITDIYGPIVRKVRNVELDISLTEEYSDNVGSVSLYKNKAQVELGYDLHRNRRMKPDAYMAVLCHEVGHVLGGSPYSKSGKGPQWESDIPSSSEGQSDYFSSLACLKKVFAVDTKETPMQFEVSADVKKKCMTEYSTIKEQNICQRSIRAGYDLMDFIISVFEKHSNGVVMPRPNMDVAEGKGLSVGTLYASFQCRYDTIKAGALNEKQPDCWYTGK